MTTIAHVSDLHFGREDPDVVNRLEQDLIKQAPDLVVVTGDLTQRARLHEFQAAREFLDRTGRPWLAVPGNHDVPFYDAFRRFLSPLDRFRRIVHPDPDPFWRNPNIAVLGLNTARSATWKDGRVSFPQIASIRTRFDQSDPQTFRIVATHHPLLSDRPEAQVVQRAPLAVKAMEAAHVDVALSGHMHTGWLDEFQASLPSARRSILSVQAGTTVSRRLRGEANSYDWLHADAARFAVEARTWDGRRFQRRRQFRYTKDSRGWKPDPSGLAVAT